MLWSPFFLHAGKRGPFTITWTATAQLNQLLNQCACRAKYNCECSLIRRYGPGCLTANVVRPCCECTVQPRSNSPPGCPLREAPVLAGHHYGSYRVVQVNFTLFFLSRRCLAGCLRTGAAFDKIGSVKFY